ncbi:MAG: DUF2924 domain-containing protein [Magnetococcales bacterium]|nr:DUF2924 domain-containing protein [Magnetococcales bacterium]MBF0583616.1 DUF2924 domain-containing protein [Magnetococcales bacterium]
MTTLSEITLLPKKSLQELNQLWRTLFNADPPQAGKDYLVRRLAYRVQELAHGGVSDAAASILDGLKPGKLLPGKQPKPEGATPAPGTRLIREWQGVEHTVTVLDSGFEYGGCKYKSLSAVAKAITGTHWSGPLFFGLRKGGAA